MKNKLTDLNDHLFAQLERLGDENISDDDLAKESERSKSITDVAKTIVSNANLQLRAIKLKAEYKGYSDEDMPKELINNKATK